MDTDLKIRFATSADSSGIREIYEPYVISTPITFDYDIPTQEEFENRIESSSGSYPWLVCEHKNEILGYAYAGKLRVKAAYQWSAESTIYLSQKFHRKGLGKILYETLLHILRLQGFVNVYAGVTVPNIKSEGFHKALGFYEVGIYKNIGYKLGRWHDVKWFQLHLNDHSDPLPLKSIDRIETTAEFQKILNDANEKVNNIFG